MAPRESRYHYMFNLRIIIAQRSRTGDFRKGIRILEETPRGPRAAIAVPRKGSVEAKERHAFSARLDGGREAGGRNLGEGYEGGDDD